MTTMSREHGPAEAVNRHPVPIRVQPRAGWIPVNFEEIWRSRELLGFLALRDLKVRYSQTILGIGWAVIQPLITMLVFGVMFYHFAGMSSEGINPNVLILSALVPWQLFEYALTQSSNSLVINERLITKIYFPRLIIPLSSVISGLVDFGIAMVVLFGVLAFYHIVPTWAFLTLPLFTMLVLITALALGFWLSAMNVLYRDVRYLVPLLVRIWLFLSPVFYTSSKVPQRWRALYALNPMAGVIEGFRWALLGNAGGSAANLLGTELLISVSATLVLFVSGLFYFRRMEKIFADVV